MPTTHHFINQFNPAMRPYIQLVKDVRPDGNCGYRVISSQMGFGEDGWRQVRRDMLNELMTHKDLYDGLYWENGRYMELLQRLDFFEDSIAGVDKWMTLPDMGHIIASCYNVVFISLSSHMCLTFLPLRSVPEPSVSRKSVAIGFVNGNHFVQVFKISKIYLFINAYGDNYVLLIICLLFVGFSATRSSNATCLCPMEP